MRKIILYAVSALALLAAFGLFLVQYSISVLSGPDIETRIQGLKSPAYVEVDGYGIPAIHASTREDAFLSLGFVTARDRLFQMDLLRRHMAGRLAEVMGPSLKESDRRHRIMGFEPVARAVVQRLPEEQKRVLEAYAVGVNQAMESLTLWPPEFLLLGYRPSLWRPEDSILVVLGMEEDLGWTADAERRASIMEAVLPEKVTKFLLPPVDRYTAELLSSTPSVALRPDLPVAELSSLLAGSGNPDRYAGLAAEAPPPKGSNGWVVGSSKTRDGRAILANDMHLSLRVPNIWYRAQLHYGEMRLSGITLPGIPLMVSGSNGKVAWGFTNIEGDFVDLVTLELDPGDPDRYRIPNGFVRFQERWETVRVKGEEDFTFKVRSTEWGPVLDAPLLAKPVAVHWTALDPEATDLNLLNIDAAADVTSAQAVFNRAGGPPLNALAADRQGNIGWTYTGKIPKRFGLDGSVSRSWADGAKGWNGYILPEELPRLINPESGYIVNANQRMLTDSYPYVIGHYFDHGYRAHRISERLGGARNLTERDLLAIQLDTKAEFYRFYQRLALSLLDRNNDPKLARLQRDLSHWDGFAERESAGFAVLTEFRKLLLDAVISPFMAKCRESDPNFRFASSMIDTPLQQLLETKQPELLPDKIHYRDWHAFLLALLIQANDKVLMQRSDLQGNVAWGLVNRVNITHPFSDSLPWLKRWLNMPRVSIPGCGQCVRVAVPGFGASERLVVSPGREGNGILHMPGGQSGHPLSPFYSDQQQAWVEGAALPMETGKIAYRLELRPLPAKFENE
jgi:penicillin amidase